MPEQRLEKLMREGYAILLEASFSLVENKLAYRVDLRHEGAQLATSQVGDTLAEALDAAEKALS